MSLSLYTWLVSAIEVWRVHVSSFTGGSVVSSKPLPLALHTAALALSPSLNFTEGVNFRQQPFLKGPVLRFSRETEPTGSK